MNISYRKLTRNETKIYRAIRLEALKLHPQSFGAKYEEQRELPKLHFETVLEEGFENHFMMGAFDGDKLIGICGFVPSARRGEGRIDTAGTLIQVYVKGNYSGKKVGVGLIQAAITAAFTQPKIEEVHLGVQLANLPAIRVYEEVGFVVRSRNEREQRMGVKRGLTAV